MITAHHALVLLYPPGCPPLAALRVSLLTIIILCTWGSAWQGPAAGGINASIIVVSLFATNLWQSGGKTRHLSHFHRAGDVLQCIIARQFDSSLISYNCF